jgi:hypothetical protein
MTGRLQRLCDEFRRRTRRLLVQLGLSRLVCFALLTAVALILTDFVWHFGRPERFLALAVLVGVVVLVAARDLWHPLRQRWSDKEVLRYLDTAVAGSDDRLINVEELAEPEKIAEARSPEGRELLARALAQLEQGLERLDLSGAWQQQRVRGWQKGALAVVAAAGLLGLAAEFGSRDRYASIGLRRLLLPWAHAPWPSSTWFVLLTPTDDASVPEGEDFTVRAEVHGRAPGQVALIYNPTDESGQFTRREITVNMFLNPDGTAEHTFRALSDSLRFRLEGGDGRTEPIEVQVVKRPFVRAVQTYYIFPPYTGVPPKITSDLQLSGLEGTQVRLTCTASVPLREAWIHLADPAGGPATPIRLDLSEDGTQFTWFHLLKDSTSYTISLTDRHGNREKRAAVHRIQVTPDQPPTARLLEPAGDLEVTRRARFKVRYQADDDYGLQQVRVLVSKDGQPPEPLDEKITGPVPQIGKNSAGSFNWDLDKLDLAQVGKLTFFLSARDVNPTGRGQADSAQLQLTLKSELEIQNNVLLAAKALLTEALLGSDNQRWAYLDAVKWLKRDGTSEPDQAMWQQFEEEQALAARAATALEARFKAVSLEMTRNRMEDAFFVRRLEQIGPLIRQQSAERQPQIAAALQAARPASAAEDTPAGRAAKRKKALAALEPALKLAALEYQRLFYLLLDWNDLQTVLVTARRLHELQNKVHTVSVQVAPKWIGKEIEDLSEAEARQLATIAQQQETIRDTERALEEELQTLALAAQAQGRKQVFLPLKDNLELLRLRAVNEKLIQVAKGIKDNRIDATLQDQLYVLKVFTFVATKLEQAGQDVPVLPPLDPKTPIADERERKVVAVKPGPMVTPAEGLVFNPESRVDVEDVGAYKINSIEQAMVFWQSILDDQVLLYTQYTDQRFGEKERSSRYRQLRLGMLGIRVQRALEASAKVQEFAREHRFQPAAPYLHSLHADLENVGRLLSAGQTGPATQALARDLSANLQNSRRFLAQHARLLAQLEDREKSRGVDEFGQPYVVGNAQLPALVQMRHDLGWALVLQLDVNQKTRRLLEAQVSPTAEPLLVAIRTQARRQALERQQKVIELVRAARVAASESLASAPGGFLWVGTRGELSARLEKELAPLAPQAFASLLVGLKAAKLGDELPARQDEQAETLRSVLARLETLADERVRPVETLAREVVETQEALGKLDPKKPADELAREIEAARQKALHDYRFDVLAERIKQAPLAPEVRNYLLQALAANPDPKYRTLISAYINPLVPATKKEKD